MNLHHFLAGFRGTISNKALDEFATMDASEMRAAEILRGNGAAIKRDADLGNFEGAVWDHVRKRFLNTAATAARVIYDGYKPDNEEDNRVFGRSAYSLSSPTLGSAGTIGFKYVFPKRFPSDGPPLKKEDCSDILGLNPSKN